MKCKTCPGPTLAVQRPPKGCAGNSCNKLIHWTRTYCPSCSRVNSKCQYCGKDLGSRNKATDVQLTADESVSHVFVHVEQIKRKPHPFPQDSLQLKVGQVVVFLDVCLLGGGPPDFQIELPKQLTSKSFDAFQRLPGQPESTLVCGIAEATEQGEGQVTVSKKFPFGREHLSVLVLA